MFSAFKKLASNSTNKQEQINNHQNVSHHHMAAGIPMSGALQKKFSKGVQYNMKIIIKGDRNVGKTCLLERLQGHGFIESYTPSEEIQVASIQWSFKATEDIVKVEVWDVVDRGKARIRPSGLKLSTTSNNASASTTTTTTSPTSDDTQTPALDAEFLDVYKNTHGVILMMDVTKAWTFEYVCKELLKIPGDIPVLILGNHCDMAHHRVVTAGQAMGFIESLTNRSTEVLYGESSMRNGFGLRLLHKFLGLPFLRLQKDTLTALLERNQRDTNICSFEIAEYLKSDDADYNSFLDNLVNKRRQVADSNSKPLSLNTTSISHSASNSSIGSSKYSPVSPSTPSSMNTNNNNYNNQNNNGNGGGGGGAAAATSELRPTKSIIVGGGQPIIIPGQLNITNDPKVRAQAAAAAAAVISTQSTALNLKTSSPPQQPHTQDAIKSPTLGFITNLFTGNNNNNNNNNNTTTTKLGGNKPLDTTNTKPIEHNISSVEEFCPDGGLLDRNFLDDSLNASIGSGGGGLGQTAGGIDSDESDNENGGNPLVAVYHDEDDDDDDNNDNEPDDDNNKHNEYQYEYKTKSNSNNNTKTLKDQKLNEPKINPLIGKQKLTKEFLNTNSLPKKEYNIYTNNNRPSYSSEELDEEPHMKSIHKIGKNDSSNVTDDDNNINNEYSNWLSDSNERRSPEGVEDNTSIVSTIIEPIKNLTESKIIINHPIQPTYNKDDDDDRRDDDVADDVDVLNDEKKHKSKKKKDKKDKDKHRHSHSHSSSSKDDKKEKKKKKKSKDLNVESFFNGTTNEIEDTSTYEAI